MRVQARRGEDGGEFVRLVGLGTDRAHRACVRQDCSVETGGSNLRGLPQGMRPPAALDNRGQRRHLHETGGVWWGRGVGEQNGLLSSHLERRASDSESEGQ